MTCPFRAFDLLDHCHLFGLQSAVTKTAGQKTKHSLSHPVACSASFKCMWKSIHWTTKMFQLMYKLKVKVVLSMPSSSCWILYFFSSNSFFCASTKSFISSGERRYDSISVSDILSSPLISGSGEFGLGRFVFFAEGGAKRCLLPQCTSSDATAIFSSASSLSSWLLIACSIRVLRYVRISSTSVQTELGSTVSPLSQGRVRASLHNASLISATRCDDMLRRFRFGDLAISQNLFSVHFRRHCPKQTQTARD